MMLQAEAERLNASCGLLGKRARTKSQNDPHKNRPVAEFRINGTKAVVWKNDTQNGPMFNTSLVRIYRDADDQWQETHSLGRDDLLSAATRGKA